MKAMASWSLLGKFLCPKRQPLSRTAIKPVKVNISAFVSAPKTILSPSRINFDEIVVNTSAEKIIRIVNKDDKDPDWEIQQVKTSSPLLKAEYQPTRGQITCLLLNKAPIGPFEEKVIVVIKDPNGISHKEIPITGRVIGPLKVKPQRLFLGNIKKNQLLKARFSISSLKKGSTFTISPVGNTMMLKLVRQKKDSSEYSVEIEAPDKQGFFKGQIVLKTDLEEQPFLYIPYAGFVKN